MTQQENNINYHRYPKPGKIEIRSSKPCTTQAELSMAYSPGVADPCLEIQRQPEKIYELTNRANSVAVVSDGTAVLGLGNIGPAAGMPVMEGKAVLFKRFAGIDAFPLCLNKVHLANGRTDTEKLIETVARLEPSFGGINLEDIGAPACFQVEAKLKEQMGIPVFHDDQHGTAIISLAGVLNALRLVNKSLSEVKIVVNGAGAAGIACAEFYIAAGASRERVVLCDSKGIVHRNRYHELSPEKKLLAVDTDERTLAEAMRGADVFLGLSVGDCVTPEMVQSMASAPIIFAMANPVPEIHPRLAEEAGAAVVGTGRTDFPNQINNVLGFPGIFRGALDVRARYITEEMKKAASRALAEIAREPVPEEISLFYQKAYPEDTANDLFSGENPLKPSYVIPKPFDPRVVPRVARYVAEAAVNGGEAQIIIDDFEDYEEKTRLRINND